MEGNLWMFLSPPKINKHISLGEDLKEDYYKNSLASVLFQALRLDKEQGQLHFRPQTTLSFLRFLCTQRPQITFYIDLAKQ